MAQILDQIKTYRPRRTILSEDMNNEVLAIIAGFNSMGTKATGGLLGVDSPFKVGTPSDTSHAANYGQILQILSAARLAGFVYVGDANYACTNGLGVDIYMGLVATPRTVTLPATPTDGQVVIVRDINHLAGSSNITLARNGKTIQTASSDLTIDINGCLVKLVYSNTLSTWVIREVVQQIEYS